MQTSSSYSSNMKSLSVTLLLGITLLAEYSSFALLSIDENTYSATKIRAKRDSQEGANETECRNLHGNCRRWARRNYCDHDDYRKFMTIKCRLSCNLCEGSTSDNAINLTCDDIRKEHCYYWVEEGHCQAPLYQKFMEVNCKRSCGLCPDQIKSNTVAMTTVALTSIEPMRPLLDETTVTSSTTASTSTQEQTTRYPTTFEATKSETTLKPTEMATAELATTEHVTSATTDSAMLTSATKSTTQAITLPTATRADPSAGISTTETRSTFNNIVTTSWIREPTSTTTSRSTVPTTSRETDKGCGDVANSCAYLVFICSTNRFAQEYCKATCGLCSTVTATAIDVFTASRVISPSSYTSTKRSTSESQTTSPADVRHEMAIAISTSKSDDITSTKSEDNNPVVMTTHYVRSDGTSQQANATSFQSATTFPTLPINSPSAQTTTNPKALSSSGITITASFVNNGVTATTTNTTLELTSATPSCSDEHPRCNEFALYTCNTSILMQLYCKQACGLCRGLQVEVATSAPTSATQPHDDITTPPITFRTTPDLSVATSSRSVAISDGINFRTTTHSIATSSQISDCVDLYEECSQLSMYCDNNVNVTNNCRRTCGYCDVTSTVSASSPTITYRTTQSPAEEVCEDTFAKCSELVSACNQYESISFLQKSCRKTCGFCAADGSENPSTVGTTDCYDAHNVCELWSESGFCDSSIYPQMREFMEGSCRKSCQLCTDAVWSEWSPCSLTCGGGEQQRTRKTCAEGSCDETITERRACAMVVCPKNPDACEDRLASKACRQYKDKGACDEEIIEALCAATCGICRNESQIVSEEWTGQSNTTSIPNEPSEICSDHHPRCGNWSARGFCKHTYTNYMRDNCLKSCGFCDVWQPWSSWSLCNATCGGGVQTRNRSCSSGHCVGTSVENIACNSFACHNCRDQMPRCDFLETMGKCDSLLYKAICRQTCGMCIAPPMEGRCADTNPKCESSSGNCYNPAVARVCPVTCRKCSPPVETSPVYVGEGDVCEDQHAGCPEAFLNNLCTDSRILAVCPYSCGYCNEMNSNAQQGFKNNQKEGTSIAIQCVNQWEFCNRLVEGCVNNSYIQQNCPVTCNLCNGSGGFSGVYSAGACVDQAAVCPTLASSGQCWNTGVRETCKQSCNHTCTLTKKSQVGNKETTSAVLKECEDKHSLCGRYRALGRCENDFLKFLCPSSCNACTDDERSITPVCGDSFGAVCLLYASKCDVTFVKTGCAKTCKQCDLASQCKDQKPDLCSALAEAGMCSVPSFRQRCPVSCGVCTPSTSKKLATSGSQQCEDRGSDCDSLRPFCSTEPSVRVTCRMTCGLCADVIVEDEFRCMDVDSRRCQVLATSWQCDGSIGFGCAKTCGRCRAVEDFTSEDCRDKYASCGQHANLCELQSIWMNCPQTCGKCPYTDQEGTSDGTGSLLYPSSSRGLECRDHMDDCQLYKWRCGDSDVSWRKYMKHMCPLTCDACNSDEDLDEVQIEGSWSKWGSWSACSKSCNNDPGPLTESSGGDRTRIRECQDGDFCEGGDEAATETGKCNKDKCPGLQDEGNECVDQKICKQWTERCQAIGYRKYMKNNCPITCGYCTPAHTWSEWSQCSVTCGDGVRTRAFECTGTNCTGSEEALTETKNCSKTPCASSWTAWSSWTDCASSCGIAIRMRMRYCMNASGAEDSACSGEKIEEAVCDDNPPCPAWGGWSIWSECSASCGEGTKIRSRGCEHSTPNSTCEGKGEETDACVIKVCPRWSEWQEWKSCSVVCGGRGTRQRMRACIGEESCGVDEEAMEEEECGTQDCPAWLEWGEWTECSATCGKEGVRKRRRECESGQTCIGDAKETEKCSSNEICIRWTDWSDFSECSVTCGKGLRRRRRECESSASDQALVSKECPGKAVDSVPCNCKICPDIGVWSSWGPFGDCSVTCGAGAQQRRRVCLNGIPKKGGCQGFDSDLRPCAVVACVIGEWGKWGNWSACSASCGGGLMTKDSGQPYYPFIRSSMLAWKLAVMAGEVSLLVVLRVLQDRTCIDGVAGKSGCPGEDEVIEKCNEHDCPLWSPWRSWTPCSASCGGVGTRNRRKACFDPNDGKELGKSNCKLTRNIAELETCNTHACPTWGDWGEWGLCTVSCGTGWSGRKRECFYKEEAFTGCEGDAEEQQICNDWDCPSTCEVVELGINSRRARSAKILSSSSRDLDAEGNVQRLICLAKNDTEKWVQVNFDSPRTVSGLSIKGHYFSNSGKFSWVKKFTVQYSNNPDGDMDYVKDHVDRPKLFQGPYGPLAISRSYWDPISARYWRVNVVASAPPSKACMKLELFGCDPSNGASSSSDTRLGDSGYDVSTNKGAGEGSGADVDH